MAESQEKAEETEISEDLRKSEARDNLFIAVTAVLAGIFLIFVIYQIVISPDQVLPLISCGVALIVDIFLMIFAIQRKFETQKKIEERKFEEIFTAQKASYFVLRKNFDELQQKISDIEEASSALPANEIVNAQKALAKVTINRNKENTDALMNSNDVLISKFTELEDKIEGNNGVLVDEERKLLDSTRDALIKNNQELKYLISDMNTEIKSLKADLKTIESQQRSIPQQPVMMAFQTMPQQMGMMPQMQPVYQQQVATPVQTQTANAAAEPQIETEKAEALDNDMGFEDDSKPDINSIAIENEPSEENESLNINNEEIETEKVDAPLSGLEMAAKKAREKSEQTEVSEIQAESTEAQAEPENKEESNEPTHVEEKQTEEIEAEEPDLSLEEPELENAETIEESLPENEETTDVVEESTLDNALDENTELTEEPVVEENTEPEDDTPSIDFASSGVDMSDPNAKMSPDDIAALFAAAGNSSSNDISESNEAEDTKLEEQAEENESEAEPQADEIGENPQADAEPEEKAADTSSTESADSGIDTSDPNRQLTPDEIAKLFASMN